MITREVKVRYKTELKHDRNPGYMQKLTRPRREQRKQNQTPLPNNVNEES